MSFRIVSKEESVRLMVTGTFCDTALLAIKVKTPENNMTADTFMILSNDCIIKQFFIPL